MKLRQIEREKKSPTVDVVEKLANSLMVKAEVLLIQIPKHAADKD